MKKKPTKKQLRKSAWPNGLPKPWGQNVGVVHDGQPMYFKHGAQKTYDFKDEVNHPAHYNVGSIESIEFIHDQGFSEGFCKGNAMKYIARAGRKAGVSEVKDLKKAIWYLKYHIETVEAKEQGRKPCRPNEMNYTTRSV